MVGEQEEGVYRSSGEGHRNNAFGLPRVIRRIVPGLVECSADISNSAVDVTARAGVALTPSFGWGVGRGGMCDLVPVLIIDSAVDEDGGSW